VYAQTTACGSPASRRVFDPMQHSIPRWFASNRLGASCGSADCRGVSGFSEKQ
jgi:hypothetical protein